MQKRAGYQERKTLKLASYLTGCQAIFTSLQTEWRQNQNYKVTIATKNWMAQYLSCNVMTQTFHVATKSFLWPRQAHFLQPLSFPTLSNWKIQDHSWCLWWQDLQCLFLNDVIIVLLSKRIRSLPNTTIRVSAEGFKWMAREVDCGASAYLLAAEYIVILLVEIPKRSFLTWNNTKLPRINKRKEEQDQKPLKY